MNDYATRTIGFLHQLPFIVIVENPASFINGPVIFIRKPGQPAPGLRISRPVGVKVKIQTTRFSAAWEWRSFASKRLFFIYFNRFL
jgi:hypothetical protein